MEQNLSEKRSFKRIPLTLPVDGKSRVKAFQGYDFQGEILDVCFDGQMNSNLKSGTYYGDWSFKKMQKKELGDPRLE
jgi:hypothetical protein